jgi:carbon-monoxide dehydrogenase medium subunit
VKPAPFRYIAPTTIEHALSLLAEHGDNAKILAGGQSLVPALNFRLARYDVLIDINRISQLAFIRHDGIVRIGSMTRQRDRDVRPPRSPRPLRGGHQIHCSPPDPITGTIGGSLSHADPAAEYPAVALRGCRARHRARVGTAPRSARDFIVGPRNGTPPDELLIEIRIAARRRTKVSRLRKSAAGREISRSLAAAAMSCADGRISDARLAIFGLGDGPALADDAARALIGHAATAELSSRPGLRPLRRSRRKAIFTPRRTIEHISSNACAALPVGIPACGGAV